MIAPPYTAEFVNLFYPMIDNTDITGMLRTGTDDQMSEFISEYILSHSVCSYLRFTLFNNVSLRDYQVLTNIHIVTDLPSLELRRL